MLTRHIDIEKGNISVNGKFCSSTERCPAMIISDCMWVPVPLLKILVLMSNHCKVKKHCQKNGHIFTDIIIARSEFCIVGML